MPRLVRLDDVWRMLDACLPGDDRVQEPHRWNVEHGGRIYYEIPLGKHGHRRNAEIEAGHIRGLVKFFGIQSSCYSQFVNLH